MKSKVKKLKKQVKGITLVALVVTIIVLLILAGVAISFTLGEDGIFKRAQEATERYENAQRNEEESLKGISNYIDDIINGNVNSGNEEEIKENIPNKPILKTGMTAIKFNEPTETSNGTVVETNENDSQWYNYENKKWANAKTEDGSMWVWIPRYAYRINESNQTVEVVFLQGTSDNYYDEEGKLQTAKRCEGVDDIVDTTEGFTVHPAFTDESGIDYRNGGWDSEIEGIWVAKFEAGYVEKGTEKSSSVYYTSQYAWAPSIESGTGYDSTVSARNYLDGIYGETETSIKYPTFQGSKYSMNYMTISDAYNISKALTESGNIYGLSSDSDSHLIKNSEWGAIAYFTKSIYGINEKDIATNTKDTSNNPQSTYTITGYNSNNNEWNEMVNETLSASSTGNIYGIYDLAGGLFELTSSYISNGNENLKNGISFTMFNNSSSYQDKSTKYTMVYSANDIGESIDDRMQSNYELNNTYGDAIKETSTAGNGYNSWYNDYSGFAQLNEPFFMRGGLYYMNNESGLLAFSLVDGTSIFHDGFRVILI